MDILLLPRRATFVFGENLFMPVQKPLVLSNATYSHSLVLVSVGGICSSPGTKKRQGFFTPWHA